MFTIGVVSDSHGDRAALEKSALRLKTMDAIIHLGDYAHDCQTIQEITGKPMLSVRGNCDFASSQPEEILQSFGKYRLLICHGHRYRVKQDLLLLNYRAQEMEAQVALFGHTHVPLVEWGGNTLFVNPGALTHGFSKGTYAILKLGRTGIIPKIHMV